MSQGRLEWVRLVIIFATLLLALAQIYAFYPGYLTHDSAYQWWQARTGNISTLWPPGTILLLRVLDQLGGGPTALYVAHCAIYWACTAWFSVRIPTRTGAFVVLLTFALLPTAAMCLPHVWTDVQLAVVLMLVVALLVRASETTVNKWARPRLILATLLIVFASTVRHNALFALLPMCWIVVRLWPSASVSAKLAAQRSTAQVVLGCSLLFAIVVGAYALTLRVFTTTKSDTWAITAIWDLQALSVSSQKVLVPSSISSDVTLVDLTQSFDPVNAVTLYIKSKSQWVNSTTGLTPAQASDLQSAWISAVLSYPWSYISHRAHVFRKMLGPKRGSDGDGGADDPVRVIFRDNPQQALAHPNALNYARLWIDWLKPQWLASSLIWLIASTLVVAAALARNSSTLSMRTALGVWLSGMLYLLPLFFFAPTADLRYVLWPTLASVLAACIAWSYRRA